MQVRSLNGWMYLSKSMYLCIQLRVLLPGQNPYFMDIRGGWLAYIYISRYSRPSLRI